ncbi:MAG: 4-oxalocrotonate tautomerase [Chloroflexi bacterium]|nr:4-oxalocrotonate tautomerase [Chloroflexota bacterium]
MPIVRVEMWTGRTQEQKAELAKEITNAVARIAKTSPDHTIVIFDDIDKSNWAEGGILASDGK